MTYKRIAAGIILLSGAVTWAFAAAPGEEGVRVTVSATNHNPLDMDVFALVGESRFRLGTVVTSQTQEFELPAQAVRSTDLRLLADPVGSRDRYVSDRILVSDGSRIVLTVANPLAQSTVTVEAPER